MKFEIVCKIKSTDKFSVIQAKCSLIIFDLNKTLVYFLVFIYLLISNKLVYTWIIL